MLPSDDPGNGSLPVTISYSTNPKANRSVPAGDFSLYLFRRHVRRGAGDLAHVSDRMIQRANHVVSPERCRVRGQAEVEHLDGAVGTELDVGRLQVAVDDSLVVGRFEGLGDLPGDGERFRDRDRAFRNPIGERESLDQFHDEGDGAAAAFEAVNSRDVRVVQGRQRLGFPVEASQAVSVCRYRFRQHLDGHVPREVGINGPIHLAHAARANLFGNLVGTKPAAWRQRHPGSLQGLRPMRFACTLIFGERSSGCVNRWILQKASSLLVSREE